MFNYNLCWVLFKFFLENEEESFNKNSTCQKILIKRKKKKKKIAVIQWHHENEKIVNKTVKNFFIDRNQV